MNFYEFVCLMQLCTYVLVCVEKDFALKLGGHRESRVVIFGRGPASEGQNGGTP